MRYAPTKRKRGVGQPIRASNTQKKPGHPRFVAPLRDVFLLDGFTRAQEDAMKLLTALITLVPAINNRWAFAAFVILVAVFLYRGRRHADVQGPLARGSRHCLIGWAKLPMPARPRGGVVTQRSAKPFTPVQFRAWPPAKSITWRWPTSGKGVIATDLPPTLLASSSRSQASMPSAALS